MAPITAFVGQAATLLIDADQTGTIKNVGDSQLFIGGPDVNADNGKRLGKGRTYTSSPGERAYGIVYTADPGAAEVDSVDVEPEPDEPAPE